jgi:hypothetical protein
MIFEWQGPAWQTPLDQAEEVKLLSLPGQSIVTQVDWPRGFWDQVGERHRLVAAEAERVIQLFRGLEVSEPARCHFLRWRGACLERCQSLRCRGCPQRCQSLLCAGPEPYPCRVRAHHRAPDSSSSHPPVVTP